MMTMLSRETTWLEGKSLRDIDANLTQEKKVSPCIPHRKLDTSHGRRRWRWVGGGQRGQHFTILQMSIILGVYSNISVSTHIYHFDIDIQDICVDGSGDYVKIYRIYPLFHLSDACVQVIHTSVTY
jgi:hypothetical protein